jgi:predicted amidophosphoribosyltransferase
MITLNYHETVKCGNCAGGIGFENRRCKKCINKSNFIGSCRTCLFNNMSWESDICLTCKFEKNMYERDPIFKKLFNPSLSGDGL